MFSRFTTALYNAVDALAPPLPLQEDFVWHWKSVTKFYTGRTSSNKVPIEVTTIPGHLLEMSSILEQEEKELEQGNIGPCMEYIMQHKLLDTMCVLGTADAPLGMRRCMLVFVTRMLKSTQQSLIPHVSIYSPVQKFILLCGEVLSAPTEKEEIELLEVICDKLKENPHLVNCFMSDNGPKTGSSHDVNHTSASKSAKSDRVQFPLIDALLKLFHSPDHNVSTRAVDCLKTCCSVAGDATAMVIVKQTCMSAMLCKTLVQLYNSLPKSMKLSDIEDPIPSDDQGECSQISPERRKFLCYLQHLHILDAMVEDAHPVVAEDIANCFATQFLTDCVYLDFIESKNPDDSLFATAVISSSMRSITSSQLLATMGSFLLGDTSEFELPGHSGYLIKDLLIERCRNSHLNLALSMSSLQLFEELLQNPTEDIMHNLVVNNLESRSYYDHTSADNWLSYSDDDSSNRYPDEEEEVLPDSAALSKTYAPSYIHKILDGFLSLVPNNLKSCETEEESGYDIYIKEAHGRFVKCLMLCENFDWPQDPVSKEEYHLGPEDDSSSDSQPEADSSRWVFYEGAFLNMIFEKLEQMLNQPYDINLQVTSLVSKLALFAHPNLHEYLLNPLIPYTSGTRSLFMVLLKVIEDIQVEVRTIKPFRAKLKQTRIALLSEGTECPNFEKSNVLEALIVIEEFCKELAAIAFVKYHAAS